MTVNDEGVLALARVARHLEKALADDGMTLPQYRVLAFLSEGDHAASKLADWLAVSRPSVTALVDGLVEQRWVERKACANDRRSVLHQITDDGRRRLASATAVLSDHVGALLEHLDADERRRAVEGMVLLGTALRRHVEAVVAR